MVPYEGLHPNVSIDILPLRNFAELLNYASCTPSCRAILQSLARCNLVSPESTKPETNSPGNNY
jgi:hypothetical protein